MLVHCQGHRIIGTYTIFRRFHASPAFSQKIKRAHWNVRVGRVAGQWAVKRSSLRWACRSSVWQRAVEKGVHWDGCVGREAGNGQSKGVHWDGQVGRAAGNGQSKGAHWVERVGREAGNGQSKGIH